MLLRDLLPLARDTVGDPRGSFRRLRALGLSRSDLWQALVAVTAASVVLAEISLRIILAQGGGAPMLAFLADPFTTALVQFTMLVLLAGAIFWGGRILGGLGSFDEAMLAVIWLQVVLAGLQVAQALALLIAPFIASLIGLFGIGLFFWLLSNFVAEVHGFRSRGRVFAGILIGLLGLSMALAFLLAIIGISVAGAADV